MNEELKELQETFDDLTEEILKEKDSAKIKILRNQQIRIAEKIQHLLEGKKEHNE